MISHGNIPASIWHDLFFLSELFRPEKASDFESDYRERAEIAASISSIGKKLLDVMEITELPSYASFEKRVDMPDADECAAYLIHYMKSAFIPGGGESFVARWKDGTARQLVSQFIDLLSADDIPGFSLLKEINLFGKRFCFYEAQEPYNLPKIIHSNPSLSKGIVRVEVDGSGDTGIKDSGRSFSSFGDFYKWISGSFRRPFAISYTWEDLSVIRDSCPTICYSTYDERMDLSGFLQNPGKNAAVQSPDTDAGTREAADFPSPDFVPAEKTLLELFLRQSMGEEPAESGWNVSIDVYSRRIMWSSNYSIPGFNYCAEDAYSVCAAFIPVPCDASAGGFQRLENPADLLWQLRNGHCIDRLYKLVLDLSPLAKRVLVKYNGRYKEPKNPCIQVRADAEFIFEELKPVGRTVHLQYRDLSESPF